MGPQGVLWLRWHCGCSGKGVLGADTSAGQPGTGMLHCPFCTLMDQARVAPVIPTPQNTPGTQPCGPVPQPGPLCRALAMSPAPALPHAMSFACPGRRRPGQFSFPTLLIKASRNRSGCFHPKAVRTARQREGRVKSLIWLH